MTTTTDNKSISGSQYLAKYIRNVQQANEATAAQYEYRLSRFEKYIAMAYKEEQQQRRQQQQNQELIRRLDDVINAFFLLGFLFLQGRVSYRKYVHILLFVVPTTIVRYLLYAKVHRI
jgi:hypothetical protein